MRSANGFPVRHVKLEVKVWGEGVWTFAVGDSVGTKQIVVHDTGVAVYRKERQIIFFPFSQVLYVTSVEDRP